MKRSIALIPNVLDKEILFYLSFPELMVAVLCSRIWRDTIIGDIALRKKVFDQDKNTQKKYDEILLNTIRSDSLDLEKIRRLLYIGVDFTKGLPKVETSTGEFYTPSLLSFAASVRLANKQDKELVRLLLKYKATVTGDDLKCLASGLLYPHNKRNNFSEIPPHFDFSHPTIMALLYSTRFENECANLQKNEKSNIEPCVFLLEAKQFDPTFVEEYMGLLQSASPRYPFQGIQENLESSTVNKIIDTREFKQLSKHIFRRRFPTDIFRLAIFVFVCYLLIKGLGINYTEKIMIIWVLVLALLKEKKAHLRFAFDKLPPEESKAYPLKNVGLFLAREDKIENLTDRKILPQTIYPGSLNENR